MLELSTILHHRDTFRQPQVQDVHSLLLRTAAIAAQVEHKRLSTLFLQIDKSTTHILGTALRKRIEIDIAHIALLDAIVRQLRQFDITTRNLETHQFARRRSHHLQQKTRTRFATQVLTDVAHRLVGHHRVVDTQDDIALLQSHLGSRHIGIRLVNDDTLQLLVLSYQRADARILTRQHHPQVLGLVLRIVLRIGIQAAEHRIDTRPDGLLGTQRIHIQQFKVLINLIEDVKMLAHLEVMILVLLSLCCKRHCQYR